MLIAKPRVTRLWVFMVGIALSAVPLHASPDTVNEGYHIAEQSQRVLFGYETLQSSWEMVIERNGRIEGERSFNVQLIEKPVITEHDLGLLTIDAPVSLRGTKLLSWSSAEGDDQQWLYTPRSKRSRRIGDRGRFAAFVSSTFSFEDLLKWQLDAYRYEAQGSAECPAGTCKLVTATPTKRASKYSRLDVRYDHEYRLSRVDYFTGEDSEPSKTLRVYEYERVGDTWQPVHSEMTDHERGATTTIRSSGYRINVPLDDAQFTPHNL